MEPNEETDELESGLSDNLILIVEDGMTTAAILTALLTKEGYRTVCTSSGEEALEAAPHLRPDLILLDVQLDGIDGFETCERLKKIPQTRDVPMLFTTSLDDKESKLKGFRIGAVDYITKPYHREELLARIRIHLRFRLSYKELMAQQLKQLQSLREAQVSLLPNPKDHPGAKFQSYYSAMHQAGGDFFDIVHVSKNIYDYIVADVSGHELGSSLAATALKSALRQNYKLSYSPSENLDLINSHLSEFLKPGQYITLTHLRIDRERNKATLINAAHPPAIHQSEHCEILDTPGDPVGCFEAFQPSHTTFPIEEGDRIFLFSDGIIEEFHGKVVTRKEGMAQLVDCIKNSKDFDLEECITKIVSYLHPEPEIAQDDLLLLGIEV